VDAAAQLATPRLKLRVKPKPWYDMVKIKSPYWRILFFDCYAPPRSVNSPCHLSHLYRLVFLDSGSIMG
jgi:hypothetical protein